MKCLFVVLEDCFLCVVNVLVVVVLMFALTMGEE